MTSSAVLALNTKTRCSTLSTWNKFSISHLCFLLLSTHLTLLCSVRAFHMIRHRSRVSCSPGSLPGPLCSPSRAISPDPTGEEQRLFLGCICMLSTAECGGARGLPGGDVLREATAAAPQAARGGSSARSSWDPPAASHGPPGPAPPGPGLQVLPLP